VYISFYIKHVPSGPAIVLVSSSLFVLALLFSPSQGILTRNLSPTHSLHRKGE
jgi:manganese/iron transport system permease protein